MVVIYTEISLLDYGWEWGLDWNFWRHKIIWIFFLRSKPHNFRASHLDPGHYLPSWACVQTHSSLLSLDLFSSWVTQERGRNLFASSLHHYSVQNMVLIQHRHCQLTLGCCGLCSVCLCALLSLSITEGT